MSSSKALKLAREKWGDKAAVQEQRNAPTADQRDEARRVIDLNRRTKGVISREAALNASHASLTYRCTVGVVAMGAFLMVKGQGDSWEEAFAAADKK